MITKQNPLTVVAPVDPTKLDQLQTLLASIQHPDIENNTVFPCYEIRAIHFARFVIINTQTDKYPVQLVFSSDFDGEETDHINELITETGEGLHKIFSCCLGFSGDIKSYWAAHKVKISAAYKGHMGTSVVRIEQEDALRTAIVNYLSVRPANAIINNVSPTEIKEEIASYIEANDAFSWAIADKGLSAFQQFLFHRKELIFFISKALVISGASVFAVFKICHWLNINFFIIIILFIASLAAVFFLLKRKLNKLENTDKSDLRKPTNTHVSSLLSAENFQVQNQLTHLVEIKPGTFRLRLLKLVLGAIQFLAKTVFNKGKLGGIPSIHFARWVIIDNGRRLLFFSNFDGTWESYLGDFVDKAGVGLTGVWSNTQNFPKTRNLVKEGAKDEQHFKQWTRDLQIPTQVWFTAYKKLSVQNINNNSFIRNGLFRNMNEQAAQQWIDRLFYNKD